MSTKDRIAAVLTMVSIGLATVNPSVAGSEPETYYPPDVEGQFRALTERAEALGWGIGDSPDPSMCYHYQGLARTHGPGPPYMFVAKSGNQPDVSVPCVQWCSDVNLPCTQVGDGPGNLLVVRLASRDSSGERLRSNRIARDEETADTRPEPGDVVVKVIDFDGQNGWPSYGHVGGLQIVGDVLAVSLEAPYEDDPSINRVLFVDVRDPENPQPLTSLPIPKSSDFSVGLVAITALPDGRYLLLATGGKNELVRVYESLSNRDDGTTDLRDPELAWTHAYDWRPDDAPVDPPCIELPPSQTFPNGYAWGWPSGGFSDYAHQSLNFVRQGGPEGPLFLIGGRDSNAAPLLGEDRFDLYRVDWDGERLRLGCVAQRHVRTFPSSDGALLFHNDLGSFAAATGSYVSPSGELILYVVEHDNDGPGSTVKSGEWRHIDMVRPGSPTYDPGVNAGGPYSVAEGSSILLDGDGTQPATKAWMQLWADPDYDDRYVVIDYEDRFQDDFDNFEDLDDAKLNPLADGFADQASSLRYFAPTGCTMVVSGSRLIFRNGLLTLVPVSRSLPGAGRPARFDDLDDVANEVEVGDLDDVIDKAEFSSDCDAYYSSTIELDWDLDRNGSFETPGRSPGFSAFELDGPSVFPISLLARHPVDGRTSTDAVEIEIVNVPPRIASLVVTDDLGRPIEAGVRPGIAGLPMAVTARFVDDGRPDTHTTSIDWNDGVVSAQSDLDEFSPATGGRVGVAGDAHVYGRPGTYSIQTTITDDDGGVAFHVATIEILDPADALLEIAEVIEAWISSLSDGQAVRALTDLLRHVIGNRQGSASNGALDQLEADNLNATMVQLREAVDSLTHAEEVTNLNFDEPQGTLGLIALSLASSAREAALTFADPPNELQAQRLAAADAAIDRGRALLAASEFAEGIEDLREAVRMTTTILVGG